MLVVALIAIFAYSATAYCNETQTYNYANASTLEIANITNTKVCTAEYNNQSFIFTGIFYALIAALIMVGIFRARAIWAKVVLSVAFSIMMVVLLRFSSWFLSITNPEEVNLIQFLDIFYGFGVRAMYFIIAGAAIFLVIIIVNIVKESPARKRRKKSQEWENWGKNE